MSATPAGSADGAGTAPGADSRSWAGWVGLGARLVLGGVLLYAGATKVGHPLTSARAVQAYELFPYEVANVIGYALPVVEIVFGALLVLGLFTRASAIGGTLLMVAFVAGIAQAWARGLTIDCGCFGGGGQVAASETRYGLEIARDLAFAACGGWLAARPASRLAVDNRLRSPQPGHDPLGAADDAPARP